MFAKVTLTITLLLYFTLVNKERFHLLAVLIINITDTVINMWVFAISFLSPTFLSGLWRLMCGAILMGFFQVRQLRWRSLSSFLSSSLSKHCHHPHILHHHLQSIHDLLHPKHSSASLSPRSPRFVHAYSRITITNVIITFIVCKVCPRRSGARSLAYHLGFWDLLVRQLHHHSWLSQVYTMKLN